MTERVDDTPCELCGFSASRYELDSDITSTAALGAVLAADAVAGLDENELAAFADLIDSVDNFEGDELDTAHHGLHTMAEIGERRAAMGRGPTPGNGSVVALHASGGGVPKPSIDTAEVRRSGVVGDVQNNRIHHGRPLQALCLWSNDVIEALQVEGHPISPGLAGENITVEGIEWESLRPGSKINVGGIPILVSAYAVPCSKVAAGFVDRDFNRILHQQHDGWSRLYAIPLGEGSVTAGDAVSVG